MSSRIAFGAVIALSALVLALVHAAAVEHFLYWRFHWFDLPVHFLGGLLVGLSFTWLLAYEFVAATRRTRARFVLVMAAVLIVGLLWEYFEYAIGVTKGQAGYWQDTAGDIVMDILGGATAYLTMSRYV
ncbi:MAG: hypothetical protein AAB923_03700 [Patescibacteria group bacterium]